MSIFIRNELEQWGSTSNKNIDKNDYTIEQPQEDAVGESTVRLEAIILTALDSQSCLPQEMDEDGNYASNEGPFQGKAPYRDFRHFAGGKKPWLHPSVQNLTLSFSGENNKTISELQANATSSIEYWHALFQHLQSTMSFNWSLHLTSQSLPTSPYGQVVTHKLMRKTIASKKRTKKPITRNKSVPS